MTTRPPRLLLEGRPGVGKTTVARALIERLRRAGIPVIGFTTEEMRRGKTRVGFTVEAASGERETMAHIDLSGPPRVGRYGVDLPAFERVALRALESPSPGSVIVVDELGKMELASTAFREAMGLAVDSPVAVVATVHVFRHPFTDALKRRGDVETIQVTHRNRDELPGQIAERMRGWIAEGGRTDMS